MMKSMKMNQNGFTLIEMMIVVTIIGILASIAMPSYQAYIVRSKLSQVPVAIAPIKMVIADYSVQNNGMDFASNDWVKLNIGAGGPTPTNEVASYSVTTGTGAITVTLATGIKAGIDGHTITVTPTFGNTGITWNATSSSTESILVEAISKWH